MLVSKIFVGFGWLFCVCVCVCGFCLFVVCCFVFLKKSLCYFCNIIRPSGLVVSGKVLGGKKSFRAAAY